MAKTTVSVGTGNWSSSGTWDNGVPEAGDTVTVTHAVTVDTDSAAGALTLATGGTIARGTYNLVVSSFTMTGGTLTGHATTGSFDVAGNISISGGTSTSAGRVRQTASGNVAIGTTSSTWIQSLTLATSAGVTSTISGATYCKKLTIGPGTITGGSYALYIMVATADAVSVDSTCTWTGSFSLVFYALANVSQSTTVYSGSSIQATAWGSVNFAWTLEQDLVLASGKTLIVSHDDAGYYLTISARGIKTGAVTLGSSADRTARLSFNYGSVASLVRGGTTTGNQVTVGNGGMLFSSGNLNFTGITLVPGSGSLIEGSGSLSNCSPSSVVMVNGLTDGGSNGANVVFNCPPRGSVVSLL